MILSAYHPVNFPDLYRCTIVGDQVSPGVVTLSGHDRNADWDIQAAKGQDGASSALNGRPIGQFQASYYLAGDADDDDGSNDFTRWDIFQRYLEAMISGPTPIARPIYHPDLARNGYTEVSVASIGGLVWDGRGGATVLVKYIELRPPKPKAVVTAKGKGGSGAKPGTVNADGKPAKPDPNAEAKRELNGLVDEARKP